MKTLRRDRVVHRASTPTPVRARGYDAAPPRTWRFYYHQRHGRRAAPPVGVLGRLLLPPLLLVAGLLAVVVWGVRLALRLGQVLVRVARGEYADREVLSLGWIFTAVLLLGTALNGGVHRPATPALPDLTYRNWQDVAHPLPLRHPLTAGPYNVLGSPSISVARIEAVLLHYNSPALGKGQRLYDLGVHYEVDPAYALAFFVEESATGTRGVATITHSIGNIRSTPGHPEYQGYRAYRTWEEGMEDWYRLIRNLYIAQWGLNTVDTILPVYAPDADHNNSGHYAAAVKKLVTSWRSQTATSAHK